MFRTPSGSFRADSAKVRAIETFLRGADAPPARVAVTLGTGMQDLAASMVVERERSFRDVPGFPNASAPSHRGVVQWGTWFGVPAIVFVGRLHLYEGCLPDLVALSCAVAETSGAGSFVLTNAAGGLLPDMQVGDLMAIDDHLNGQGLARCRPVEAHAGCSTFDTTAPDDAERALRLGHAAVYSSDLLDRAKRCAESAGVALRQGVYLGVPGPTYETRAEYRAFRRIGADAVGMSTTLEASAARTCGMHVLGFSMITNVARPDVVQKVAGEDVVAAAKEGVPRLRAILDALFRSRSFDDLPSLERLA